MYAPENWSGSCRTCRTSSYTALVLAVSYFFYFWKLCAQ